MTDMAKTAREVAPSLFEFLATEHGFDGPERLEDGVAYHGSGMSVVVGAHDGREPEVVTVLEVPHAEGVWRATLSEVFAASGVGVRQDVPEGARGERLTRSRLEAHARALRRLLEALDADEVRDAVRQNHGR